MTYEELKTVIINNTEASWQENNIVEALEAYLDRIVEKLESEISSNRKLIPPRGGKAFYEGTIRGLRKALKIVKEGGK